MSVKRIRGLFFRKAHLFFSGLLRGDQVFVRWMFVDCLFCNQKSSMVGSRLFGLFVFGLKKYIDLFLELFGRVFASCELVFKKTSFTLSGFYLFIDLLQSLVERFFLFRCGI